MPCTASRLIPPPDTLMLRRSLRAVKLHRRSCPSAAAEASTRLLEATAIPVTAASCAGATLLAPGSADGLHAAALALRGSTEDVTPQQQLTAE